MTLVLSIQPYHLYSHGNEPIKFYETAPIVIDCDEEDVPVIPLPMIEYYLKRLLGDGQLILTQSVSVILWEEKCDPAMTDTSDIVLCCRIDLNSLHNAASNWW